MFLWTQMPIKISKLEVGGGGGGAVLCQFHAKLVPAFICITNRAQNMQLVLDKETSIIPCICPFQCFKGKVLAHIKMSAFRNTVCFSDNLQAEDPLLSLYVLIILTVVGTCYYWSFTTKELC